MDKRHYKIAEVIKRTLVLYFQKNLYIGREAFTVTISEVRLSKDYSWADVYVTPLYGMQVEEKAFMGVLIKEKAQVRHFLSRNAVLRKTPDLRFIYDASYDHANRMDALLGKGADV